MSTLDSNLDMFITPTGEPILSPRGAVLVQGIEVTRPDEAELKTFVHLDQDDYRMEYRKRCGRWPNAHAWLFWHKQHDKIVLRRGLR